MGATRVSQGRSRPKAESAPSVAHPEQRRDISAARSAPGLQHPSSAGDDPGVNLTSHFAPSAAAPAAPGERFYRIRDLMKIFSLCRKSIERAKSSGRIPPPDLYFGRMPMWRTSTIDDLIRRGGRI